MKICNSQKSGKRIALRFCNFYVSHLDHVLWIYTHLSVSYKHCVPGENVSFSQFGCNILAFPLFYYGSCFIKI